MEKVPQLHMFSSPSRRSLGKHSKYAMQDSFYSGGFSKQSARLGDQKLQTDFKCTRNYYNQALKLLGSTSSNQLTSYAGSHEARMREGSDINLQKFRKRNQLPQQMIKANPQVMTHQRPVLIQQQQAPNMRVIYRGPSPPQHQVFIRPQTPPPRGPIIFQNGPILFNPNASQHLHPPMFVHASPMTQGPPLLHSTSVNQMPSYEQMIKTAPTLMNPPSRQNDQDHIIEIDGDCKPQLTRHFTFGGETSNKQNRPIPKRNPFSLDAAYLFEVQDCERRLPQLSRIYDSSKNAEQSTRKETLMDQLMEMREENLKTGEKCLGDLDRILQRFGEQGREGKRQQLELTRTRKSLFAKAK